MVSANAQEVNKHHHTKTCRKHDTSCRFGYPRFPSSYTIIVEPCKEKDQEKRKEKLTKNRLVLRKVKEVLEDEESISQIMKNHSPQDETKEEHRIKIRERIKQLCDLAGVTVGSYYIALSESKSGYALVQRRDLNEIYINSYNPEWIRAWNGNMDIQIVLDYFAVITYVTDYYAKDDTGK